MDVDAVDLLIHGEERMATEVCGLLEHDAFEAQMPGLFSASVRKGPTPHPTPYGVAFFTISFAAAVAARPQKRAATGPKKPTLKQAKTTAVVRWEVASCGPEHEGEWKGDWEECEMLADHGHTCDVRIVSDRVVCSWF